MPPFIFSVISKVLDAEAPDCRMNSTLRISSYGMSIGGLTR